MYVGDKVPNKKTAELLSKKCSNIIWTAEKKYNCQIKSKVTDIYKNVEKMKWELNVVVQSENSCLTSYGCAAHWLNLLGKDITPSAIINM